MNGCDDCQKLLDRIANMEKLRREDDKEAGGLLNELFGLRTEGTRLRAEVTALELKRISAETEAEKQRQRAEGLIDRLISELNRHKTALTRAVSLPKGQLPHGSGYYTLMMNGQCVVKEEK